MTWQCKGWCTQALKRANRKSSQRTDSPRELSDPRGDVTYSFASGSIYESKKWSSYCTAAYRCVTRSVRSSMIDVCVSPLQGALHFSFNRIKPFSFIEYPGAFVAKGSSNNFVDTYRRSLYRSLNFWRSIYPTELPLLVGTFNSFVCY